jgi:hypothetical protein
MTLLKYLAAWKPQACLEATRARLPEMNPMNISRTSFSLLLLLVCLPGLIACGSGSPPAGEIAVTRELDPVQFLDIIRGRGRY